MPTQDSQFQSTTEKLDPVSSPSSRDEVFSGMACVDTSGNPNIPVLMEMVGALSRATDPHEVVRDFSDGLRRIEKAQGYISLSTRGLEPGQYKITRMVHEDQVSHLGEADPWSNWEQLPVQSGGFLGEIIRQAYPEIIHHVFLKNDPVLGDMLATYGSLMAIPLFDQGEPLNWAILLRTAAEGFDQKNLEEAILRSNLVGTTVRNVLAASKLRAANEEIHRELQQIANIQKALLPKYLPAIPGIELGAHYEVFDVAGGDMYDIVPLHRDKQGKALDPSGLWSILIADASGHGPAAATIVAMLNAILYAVPDDIEGPGAELEFANRHLVAKGFEGTFVTALLARYDPATRELTYARAGHLPPVLMKIASPPEFSRLDAVGGLPLGVVDDAEFEQHTVTLAPGQTLVFYTDGITEAFSPEGDMFGIEGIESSLTECSGDPDCVINHITAALKKHERGVRPSDDQTIVVMKIT